VQELVEFLRANPGKYTIRVAGIGTTPHLSSELFNSPSISTSRWCRSPRGGPSIQSVVAGHTPICIRRYRRRRRWCNAGKVRRASHRRQETLAGAARRAPPSTRVGIKDQEAETMQGVFVPAATPKPVVELLQREIAASWRCPT
jgi:tripartite-type tricarboxylate transporter receptor subunit TctC